MIETLHFHSYLENNAFSINKYMVSIVRAEILYKNHAWVGNIFMTNKKYFYFKCDQVEISLLISLRTISNATGNYSDIDILSFHNF